MKTDSVSYHDTPEYTLLDKITALFCTPWSVLLFLVFIALCSKSHELTPPEGEGIVMVLYGGGAYMAVCIAVTVVYCLIISLYYRACIRKSLLCKREIFYFLTKDFLNQTLKPCVYHTKTFTKVLTLALIAFLIFIPALLSGVVNKDRIEFTDKGFYFYNEVGEQTDALYYENVRSVVIGNYYSGGRQGSILNYMCFISDDGEEKIRFNISNDMLENVLKLKEILKDKPVYYNKNFELSEVIEREVYNEQEKGLLYELFNE